MNIQPRTYIVAADADKTVCTDNLSPALHATVPDHAATVCDAPLTAATGVEAIPFFQIVDVAVNPAPGATDVVKFKPTMLQLKGRIQLAPVSTADTPLGPMIDVDAAATATVGQ